MRRKIRLVVVPPRLVRRHSAISGWGVYATHPIEEDAAVGGNITRYINHACDPNCYTDIVCRRIWILAARRIEAGEELTYDYNTEGLAGIACLCRPGCGRVL